MVPFITVITEDVLSVVNVKKKGQTSDESMSNTARGSMTFSAHTLKMDSGVSLPLKLDLAAGNLCHCESFSAQCDSQKSTDGWIPRRAYERWWSLSVVVDHFWLMTPLSQKIKNK